jgi:poly(A) polymerase
VKTLLAKGAEGGFELMRTTGLLGHFLPELGALYGVTQNAWHIYDVWTHTFRVLGALPKDAGIVLRLAALLHDIAKPETRSVSPDGAVHFYGHEDVGVDIARGILGRLKFDNDTIRDVCALVGLHMRYGQVTDDWSRTALRRLVRAVGPYQDDLFVLTLADAVGSGTAVRIDVDGLKVRLADACAGTDVASAVSPLDGGALMRLAGGRAAGPWLGAVKRYLEGLVVDGDLAPGDVLRAETLAREFLARELR